MSKPKLVLFTDSEYKKICKNPPANFRFPGYYIIESKQVVIMNPAEHKPTLKDVLNSINDFKAEINKKVDEGFKHIDARIDKLETRLDYIVTANNLKDVSSKNKK